MCVDPKLNLFFLPVFLALTAPIMGAQPCGQPGTPPEPLPFDSTETREACDHRDLLRKPFFGDLHVHTSSSLDADLQGTRLGPDGAYDFAQGSTVGIQPYDENGDALRTLTIDRPLDFAMVSDHAEFFGETSLCTTPGSPSYDSIYCVGYRNDPEAVFLQFNGALGFGFRIPGVCGEDGQLCVDESVTLWNELQQAADDAYDRSSACEFTSFVGYEWTGSPLSRNLHRNVVFRNEDVPTIPAAYFEHPSPEDLWDALDSECRLPNDPGTFDCEYITIPHNSNLSGGTYFNQVDRDGNPYTTELAFRRQRNEPLVEVIQHKGQSECTPGSSPNDELCDFEVLPYSLLRHPVLNETGTPFPQDFVRDALKEGLRTEQALGANPFKYGMVGGTDTHLGTPGAVREGPEEQASQDPESTLVVGYPGHGGAGAAAYEMPPGLTDLPSFNPGGLTVIWAEENSRDALFEAMQRREVYATSGTRPVVRFFGSREDPGFRAQAGWCARPTMIEDAYAEASPMGGDIGPNGHLFDWLHAPSFLVSVLKDPDGNDIQRVQIVKVSVNWLTGEAEETVYDIAGDAQNGASVNLNTCEPTGAGLTEVCTTWVDPNFSPLDRAFYYVRVVENPTCRWHKHQCNAGGVDCGDPQTITEGFEACCDGSVPDTIQERAWTSPIWFQHDQ